MIKYNTVQKICSLWRKNPFNDNKFINKSKIKFDDNVYLTVKCLVEKYSMDNAVLEHDEKLNPQLSFIKFTGTNGKEGSIKSSLLDVYHLLNDLDGDSCVKWSQVLDISIDNLDDVYAFLVTLILK